MALSTTSILSLTAAIVTAVGLLFTLIGLGTAAWVTGYTGAGGTPFGYGLFEQCLQYPGQLTCLSLELIILPDWYYATRGLVIFGFLVGVACLVVLIVHVCKSDNKILQIVGMALAFTTAFLVLVGVIVYGAEYEYFFGTAVDLDWSFALTVVAGVLFLISGIIVTVAKIMVKQISEKV